jgi:predicted nucleic acid-binding protein
MMNLFSANLKAGTLVLATAKQLNLIQFLTFDENQKKLAEAEGLLVPI